MPRACGTLRTSGKMGRFVMIFGLPVSQFTILHVIISLIGIGAGLIAVLALDQGRLPRLWTAVFLTFTALTAATGFMFPLQQPFPSPAFITGVISTALLAIAIYALYARHAFGSWRWIYIVTAILAQWFNSFVLIIQSFQKVGPLTLLAPTQTETPFLLAQALTLLLYVVVGFLALRKFRPVPVGAIGA